jgi:hypothetical protein
MITAFEQKREEQIRLSYDLGSRPPATPPLASMGEHLPGLLREVGAKEREGVGIAAYHPEVKGVQNTKKRRQENTVPADFFF